MIYEVLGFHPDKKYAQIFIEAKDFTGEFNIPNKIHG